MTNYIIEALNASEPLPLPEGRVRITHVRNGVVRELCECYESDARHIIAALSIYDAGYRGVLNARD